MCQKLKSFVVYLKNIWTYLTMPDDVIDLMNYIDNTENVCSECEFKSGYCSLCPVTYSIQIKQKSCNWTAYKDASYHFPKQFFGGCAST